MPEEQRSGDQRVDAGERPPGRRQQATVKTTVGAIEPGQRPQRQCRGHHRDDHRDDLQHCRRRRETGVDGRGDRDTVECGSGQVGEDADQLGPQVAVEGPLPRRPGRAGDRGDGAFRVRGQGDRAVPGQVVHRCRGEQRVAGDHLEHRRPVVTGRPDTGDQSVALTVGSSRGECGEDGAAVRQRIAHGPALDRGVEIDRRIGHQRGRDAGVAPALRPVDGRSGLCHGQERHRDRCGDPHDGGEHRPQTGPLVDCSPARRRAFGCHRPRRARRFSCLGHEERCYR
ncbi:Uncharacterised protein [Rhodococcus rhodochrous]|nr:Uncharacterised protein [Rhodococcus rhodochrous]